MNEIEKELIDLLDNLNKKNIILSEITLSFELDKPFIEKLITKKFEIPDIFLDDVENIRKSNKMKSYNDQLKLDIYDYLFDENKNHDKYKEEFKRVSYYYICQLYPKIAIAYCNTVDNKEIEREVAIIEQKKVKQNKMLIAC